MAPFRCYSVSVFISLLLGSGNSFVFPNHHHGAAVSGASSLSKIHQYYGDQQYYDDDVPRMRNTNGDSRFNDFDEGRMGGGQNGGGGGYDESLGSLSVTELKRLLSERGIDFRDCLEKRDLIERLRMSQSWNPNMQQRMPSFPMEGLSDQEQSRINTFKRVSPSVANIKTTTLTPQLRGLQLQGLEVPQGSGSGFLWDEKGHVVTNFHVVSAGRRDGALPSTVKVKLAGMAEAMDADIVGVEPEKDLAVLKLRNVDFRRGQNLPRPIDVGTSNDLQVGQSVMAIGNPFGLDDTLTTGIVSALGRDVAGIGGRPIHGCIQTDASINP